MSKTNLKNCFQRLTILYNDPCALTKFFDIKYAHRGHKFFKVDFLKKGVRFYEKNTIINENSENKSIFLISYYVIRSPSSKFDKWNELSSKVVMILLIRNQR